MRRRLALVTEAYEQNVAYKIDSHVPLPPLITPSRYPVAHLEVGQSFFHACKKDEQQKYQMKITASASNYAMRKGGRTDRPRYSVRQVTEKGKTGVRCWRVS